MTEHKNLKRLIRERQARTGESYTTARRHLTGGQPHLTIPDDGTTLSALFALLERPGLRFQSVQVNYRVWRRHDRLREARRADIEAVRAGGQPVTSYGPGTGDPQPSETEELVCDWRQGDGFRHEIHGGAQDSVVGVAANGVWWWWRPHAGGKTNAEDPSVPNPLRRGLAFTLDPEEMIGLVEFEVTGRSEVAGRASISARAKRLPLTSISGPGPSRPFMALYPLGSGADHYQLEVDAERGVLLAASATYNGDLIQTITAQEISFDDLIPLDVFTFEFPEGTEVLPLRQRPPG